METITNAASTVTSTVSNLIYGQPTKENETAGQEPISGEQGKGTANDPFDKGNTENATDASKTNTSTSADVTSKPDEFLKLDPTIGKPTTTTPTPSNTGAAGNSSLPVVPLTADTASSDPTPSSATGITDKAGVTDQVWKPTELDQVKPGGAPGAGPSAPAVTPAAPETSSDPSKGSDVAKDNASSEVAPTSSAPKKASVGNEQIDAILTSTPKAQHSVPDEEANDPHSKMTQKTVRQTDASKASEGGEAKDLATEKSGRKSESSPPGSGDEKSGRKMSQLKDKLKDKLHIGSKDK